MNQREINKLIFKFVVKNVCEHEGKLLPYSFILPRINKMNWCSEESARKFLWLMWKKEYFNIIFDNGVQKIQLTKKACDQIRAWNAEEEEEAERAYMVACENFKENPSGTKSVSDYEPSGEQHDYDAHGTRLI